MDIPESDSPLPPRGLYIGGQWRSSERGATITSINPANGQKLGEVPLAGARDVDRAVQAARDAMSDWSRLPVTERAHCLERLAEEIAHHREDLAMIDCLDSGNVLRGMHNDIDWTIQSLRYFAGLAREIKGETFSQEPGHLNLTMRKPFGVVARINPFNHPLRYCAEKSAPALAAGNTIVVKGSEQAPLSSLRFAEICHGIFPPGVINVITGDAETGAALVRHPDVRRIGFIGSVETGRTIAREAGADLKHVSLELGGKNPIIIFPDADPGKAATLVIKGMNMDRQGQSCSSTSRVFVHESIYAQVLEKLVERTEALRVGLPWLSDTDMGPVVSQRQFDRVWHYIKLAIDEGATPVLGATPPKDESLKSGFFILPTIFVDVTWDMKIAREEIFGPVMAVVAWTDFEDMMEQCNSLSYGLTASIVTEDLSKAMLTAEKVEAGYVWINSSGRYLGAPYGGWKNSGIGKEECLDELLSYTQVKNINMRWSKTTD